MRLTLFLIHLIQESVKWSQFLKTSITSSLFTQKKVFLEQQQKHFSILHSTLMQNRSEKNMVSSSNVTLMSQPTPDYFENIEEEIWK